VKDKFLQACTNAIYNPKRVKLFTNTLLTQVNKVNESRQDKLMLASRVNSINLNLKGTVELSITFQAGSQNIYTVFAKNKRCTSYQVPNNTDTVILATVANLILINKDKNITKSGNWQP
jgi:hypothetical protein